MFSGAAFSRGMTISASVGSANLGAILNFTTHRILAEILVVKEPIRELHCHYLETCVYNNFSYTREVGSDLPGYTYNYSCIHLP